MGLMDEDSDYGLWQPLFNNYTVNVKRYMHTDIAQIKTGIERLRIDNLNVMEVVKEYLEKTVIPSLPKNSRNSGMKLHYKVLTKRRDSETQFIIIDETGIQWVNCTIMPRII